MARCLRSYGDPIPYMREVRPSDIEPLRESQFDVERMDAAEAVRKHGPLIVISSWMTIGEDWTKAFRDAGVVECVPRPGGHEHATAAPWSDQAGLS